MNIQDITNRKKNQLLRKLIKISSSGTIKDFLIDNRYLFVQQIDRADANSPFYYSVSDQKYKMKINETLLVDILNSELVDQELIKTYGYKIWASPQNVTYIVLDNE